MEPQADLIRSIPIFSALSREDIAKVLGKMEEISLSAGATIFSQGDQGDAFYLIQSGAVQVVVDSGAGNAEVVAILGAKDWFRRDGAALRRAPFGDHQHGKGDHDSGD
jgi:CRP-like cAMP-binding protein